VKGICLLPDLLLGLAALDREDSAVYEFGRLFPRQSSALWRQSHRHGEKALRSTVNLRGRLKTVGSI
jgi:hypothetical protein